MSGFLGFIFIVLCSTFQNGYLNLGVLSDTIWSGTLSLLRVSIGLLFTKIEEKILIFHFVLFTFNFNSRSVFTLHCNILWWNLLKWPPYNAPLTDPPERNQDFENEKRYRPTTLHHYRTSTFDILYIYLELWKPGWQTFCNFSQLPLSNSLFTVLIFLLTRFSKIQV